MVKIFKAKAKGEMKAMQVAGEGAAQDFLKGMWASTYWDGMVEEAGWFGWVGLRCWRVMIDQLKKNPVVDPGELDEVADGLGQEKLAEFGKGGGFGKGLKL
jgi:hypothetical protein